MSYDIYTALNITATAKDKVKIDNISFTVGGSEMLGIMGNAKSGGDILCRALGGRLLPKEKATGQIREPDAFSLQYVDFKDEFPNYLTVYEILTYCNRIRSAHWAISDSVKRFGLMDRCHVRCSDLSEYERRLVILASKSPQLYSQIIVQNPTRGLDAHEAHSIIQALRHLSDGGLRVIVQFDTLPVETAAFLTHLLYVRSGCLVYAGYNWKKDLPTFLLERGIEEGEIKKSYFESLRLADLNGADTRVQITSENTNSITQERAYRSKPKCCTHRSKLFFRYKKHIARMPWHFWRQMHYSILMSALCVSLFYNVNPTFSTKHVHFVLCVLTLHLWSSVALLPSLCAEERLYDEDQYQGRYSPFMYWLVRSFWDTLIDIFVSTFITILVCVPLHYMDSVEGGVIFLVSWGLAVRVVSTRSMVIISRLFHNSLSAAIASAVMLISFQYLTCGIVAAPSSMIPVLKYVREVSFPTYALAAIMIHLEKKYPQQSQIVLAEYEIRPADYAQDPLYTALYFAAMGFVIDLALRSKGYTRCIIFILAIAGIATALHI
jgi:ABC-type multidrug transport system ATPase subunit